MASASITFDTKALERAIRSVPNLTKLSLASRLEKIGDEFERRMDARFTAKLSGPFLANKTKGKLANRSGSLRRSMNHRVIDSGGAAQLVLRNTIGNAHTAHYVFTQEGKPGKAFTVIRPKRASKLIIPMPDNKTAGGSARFTNPRTVEGLFKFTSKSGKQFLAISKEDGELSLLWILKDEVKIPARLGFVKTWNTRSMKQFQIRELNAGVRRALEKAGLM